MKKLVKLFCCFVLVFNTTLYAGNLQLTASNLGNGQVAIGYEVTSGSDVPVGFGLNVMLTNGATFSSIVSASSYFPIYPGTIMIDNEYGIVTDYGTPVSPSYMPGSLGSIGTNGVTLEMALMPNLMEVGIDPQGAGDLNWDGFIDFLDMGIIVSEWLINSDGYEINSDINRDGIVNMYDLAVLVTGGETVPPLNLSQLVVLQINLNGAANTTLTVSSEDTYRGGVVDGQGMVFSATPISVIVPEPATIILLTLGGMVLRRKR